MHDPSSLSLLKGVGPRKAAVLLEAGVRTLDDLFDYFPRRYLDRRAMKRIAELAAGENATVVGRVVCASVETGAGGRSRFKAVLADETGRLELTWFRGVRFFSRHIVSGESLAVYGKVGFFGSQPQMQHPEYDRLGADRAEGDGGSDIDLYNTGHVIAMYPASEGMKQAGLSSRQLRHIVASAFRIKAPGVQENLPGAILRHYRLMPLLEAYREVHFPSSPERLQQALSRMKFNELFYAQLLFALRRAMVRSSRAAVRFTHSGKHTSQLYEALPFELTQAQKQAVREIYRDLRSGSPMQRLVQGDVGSGKTVVAMFAIALAADNGLQSAFMAPTEILAVQHWLSLRRFFEPLGLRVALLSGRQKKRERESILAELERGELHVAVGTHALIEPDVRWKGLGLVVIDEQHRFGVLQRKALQEKAINPHVLLMTATPIPRTLTMGVFGDLDVSLIRQLPAGRKPVRTLVRAEGAKREVYGFLLSELRHGRQGYIVFPLVEESEKMDLKAAVESYGELSTGVFAGFRLGLIHGQMLAAEKDDVMGRFRAGELDVLVGTTVIEVGVDVPNATVMVIEHAERFGLAQLHQLRGRVGRGEHPSSCFLVHANLTPDASERLSAMASTADGFVISEIDARIRGMGNVLGKEQSGHLSGLKIADLSKDFDIMQSARAAAFGLVSEDGQLRHAENAPVRAWYLRHYHDRFTLAEIG